MDTLGLTDYGQWPKPEPRTTYTPAISAPIPRSMSSFSGSAATGQSPSSFIPPPGPMRQSFSTSQPISGRPSSFLNGSPSAGRGSSYFSGNIRSEKGSDYLRGIVAANPNAAAEIGATSNAGGKWAILDQMNPQIQAAAEQTGTPANLIKAVIYREGGGKGDRNIAYPRGPNDPVYAFNGVFKSVADSWGLDWNRMIQDDAYAIYATGYILSQIKATNNLPTWEDTVAFYFAGPNGYQNMQWGDELGNTVESYLYHPEGGVITNWRQLDQMAGTPSGVPSFGDGSQAANTVLQAALTYVGVPYRWGVIPGKGDDPWATGWDCSALVYWLDQNYGTGQIPMGSHYQYEWAKQTNRLKMDPAALAPGDLVFFDTGDRSGGGAHLNGASHVGIYLGNGQFLHAANENVGTIVSDLQDYIGMYTYLGGATTPWSSSSGGVTATTPGMTSAYFDPRAYQQNILFGNR